MLNVKNDLIIKDIERIKGKNFSQLPAHESAVKLIFDDLLEIRTRFVFIADKLKEIKQFKYYEKFGYTDIIAFAEDFFGFGKSTTYGLLNIATYFCNGNMLKDEYKGFSQSQLIEMSSMLVWQSSVIKPDMTVQDIKDYKKAVGQGGIDYKGIHFRNARQIIDEYRKDKELKFQTSGITQEENSNKTETNKQLIVKSSNKELNSECNKLSIEERLLVLFKNQENFSIVASKILLKHYNEPDCKFFYKSDNRPLKDLFPCLCNVLFDDILKYLKNPSVLDEN